MNPTKNLIIIGAMKAGTSSLFHYLKQHPSICPSIQKEPEYFARNHSKRLPVASYKDLFDCDETTVYAMEASTGCTKYPKETGIPARIKEETNNAKFIYVVRNPFERIESHFNFMNANRKWDREICSDYMIAVSNYYLQLKQYEQHFDKDRFLIIDFEELKTDPQNMINKVTSFLELEEITLNNFQQVNKTVYETKPVKIIKKIAGGGLNFVPQKIKDRVKKMLLRNFKPIKTKLTHEQRQKVYAKLKNDMLKFQEVYGFNVQKWGFE